MSRLPSVMGHDFSRVPKIDTPRSSFDRSFGLKTAFDAGYLVPIYLDEANPGDTFSLNMTGFARLATPLHPFMDNLFINTFFFAVPLRLVWSNFVRLMGERPNPDDSVDFVTPQIVSPVGGYATGSLFDFMDLPPGVPGLTHSALPLRAVNLIWNEWFRDQNLQDRVVQHTDDGPDPYTDYTLLRRGKRHDYFTSCLPWPQKGEAVDIPIGTQAPITGLGVLNTFGGAGPINNVRETDGTLRNYTFGIGTNNPNGAIEMASAATGAAPQIFANLSEASGATINQLRQAFKIQVLYEVDARGGTRYTEIMRAHFNVISPDARLQRPEYLGGGQSPIQLHTVPQNSGSAITGSDTPQGNLAAYGTSHMSGHGFTKSFTEHCVVIGFACVRADLNYQQGLNRMWSRNTKFDYYWPELATIGEQAVLNKEIFAQGSVNPTADASAWGYQERYGEFRYKPSSITGVMRSSAAQSLDTWHLAQDFATLPFLNEAFIVDDPPIERVIAVTDQPAIIFDSYFKYRCARPMPVYGVPSGMRL